MEVHADLGLRCPHMPEDTFLYGAAHNMMLLYDETLNSHENSFSNR